MTAWVKTRTFRVLERGRLSESIAAEKALNHQGMTTGAVGQSRYAGATYMFDATISEATTDSNKTSFSLGIAGAAAGKGWSPDTIAIDVCVTDVESGIVVEAGEDDIRLEHPVQLRSMHHATQSSRRHDCITRRCTGETETGDCSAHCEGK